MKKIRIAFYTFFLSLFTLAISGYAASTSEAIHNVNKQKAYFELYGQEEKAPVTTVSGGEEKILTAEGNLSFSATDLSLPGKNGFDLNFTRKYNSNEIYNKYGDFLLYSITSRMVYNDYNSSYKKVYQYYAEGDETQSPVYIAYENEEELLKLETNGKLFLSSAYTSKAITNWDNTANALVYSCKSPGTTDFSKPNPFYHARALPGGNDITLVRDRTRTPAELRMESYRCYIYDSYDNIDKLSIGNGWSFEMFSAEGKKVTYETPSTLRKAIVTEEGEFRDPDTGLLLTYRMEYRDHKVTGYDPDDSDFLFVGGDVLCYSSSAERYLGTSMYEIRMLKGMYDCDFNNPDDYSIEIERYDGVVFCLRHRNRFDRQLIKTMDRFGNTIRYTGRLGMDGMIDSYGRTVTLEKNEGKITGILVDGVRAVTYEHTDTNDDSLDPHNVLMIDNIHSLKVTKGGADAPNNTTIYSGKYHQNIWIMSDELDTVGSLATLNGDSFNLEEILLPTGGKICYHYATNRETIPSQSHLKRDRRRISQRKELLSDSTTEINKKIYTYDQSNLNSRVATTKKAGVNYTYREYYSRWSQLEKTEEQTENGIVKKEYTYTRTNEGNEIPVTIVITQYNANQNNAKSITKTIKYNTDQQIIQESDGLHEKNLTYYSYGLLSSLTIKQADNKVIGMNNIFSSDRKKVIETKNFSRTGTSSGVTHERTQYTYNEYGEIASVTQRGSTGTDVRTTEIAYEYLPFDESNPQKNTFVKTTTLKNVKNISEDGARDIITKEYYDYFGNIYRQTDGENRDTYIYYDSIQRPVKQVFPDQTEQRIQYDNQKNEILLTDQNGNQKKITYDSIGRQTGIYAVAENDVPDVLTTIAYTAHSQIQEKCIYATGNTVKSKLMYTYYADGKTKSETIKEGNNTLSQIEYSYDPGYSAEQSRDRVQVYRDGIHYVTVWNYYDLYGRKTKEEIADESRLQSRTFTYDLADNVVTQTDYKGNVTTLEYDHQNRVIRETDAFRQSVFTEYNPFGEITGVTDRRGYKTTTEYNALKQKIEVSAPIQRADKSKIKYFYDAAGNLTKQYQQNNKSGEAEHFKLTETVYDVMNRPVSVISNDGSVDNVVKYEYDGLGNITKMATGITNWADAIDPTMHAVTTYTYNHLNQLISTTDPQGNSVTNTYDKLGNVLSMTDKAGGITAYTYNGLGQMLSVTANRDGKTENISYQYDWLGNVTQMTDSSGTTNYTYDGLGQLLKEAKGDIVKDYTYDANGNRLTFQLTNSGTVEWNTSYEYDKLNRLREIRNGRDSVSYSYDANGNVTEAIDSSSIRYVYSYNMANQLSYQTNLWKGKRAFESYSIRYYLDGNIESVFKDERTRTSYMYDDMGRLTQETVAGETQITYQYDNFQNRSQKTVQNMTDNTVSTTNYSYNRNNQLIQETSGDEEKQYCYDANGNLTAIQQGEQLRSFAYDPLNRMTASTVHNVTTAYTYNGNGLRQTKTTNGVTTSHIYDGQNIVMDIKPEEKQVFHRGISLISRTVNGGNKEYYYFNVHKDISILSDKYGDALNKYSYDAFGTQIQEPNETDNNPFRYCGEYFDSETGFVYLRARYYDPNIGRFTTEDPAKDGLNWYVYCGNNPVSYIDPNGLDAIVITNRNSVNLPLLGEQGHTSAIYQDANGEWYYTYWGNKAVAVIHIPSECMGSLNDFNARLNKFLKDNGFSSITSDYTDATYVVGNFTASLKAAYEDVNTAANHKNSTGYIYTVAGRTKVHQGDNGAYQWNTNNCLDRTYASLSKGSLVNGMNAGTYMRDLGFKGGMIPNNAIAKFNEVFMNNSFTYSGAYGGLYNYAYYYSINSEWAQKWQKANYANAIIGR